jgi:hypothetical protein
MQTYKSAENGKGPGGEADTADRAGLERLVANLVPWQRRIGDATETDKFYLPATILNEMLGPVVDRV